MYPSARKARKRMTAMRRLMRDSASDRNKLGVDLAEGGCSAFTLGGEVDTTNPAKG
jgi:hypothetical protein